MRNKLMIAAVSALMALMTRSCTYSVETVEKDTETVMIQESEQNLYNEGQNSVTDEIKVEGEDFSLLCTYGTGNMPLDKWRVTSNKQIEISVCTKNLPDGYIVHVEHVHADIFLRSTSPQINGITQDSMDDSDHRTPTQGFKVADTTSYNTVFSIEGYTDHFYSLWGYAFGQFGTMSSSYERLTEANIREVGTYAEELAVVYDLVIQPEDGDEYVKSVYSKVLIPLTGEIETREVDFFTGKEIDPGIDL